MSNLLATPRAWAKKAVLLKEEPVYGIDPTPTGAANHIEARNVSLTSFDAEAVDRNIIMPHFGNGGKIISSIWSKLSFEVALAPSGTAGEAPKWGPVLLGLGFAETLSPGVSVTYNLVSASIKGLTAYLNIDGVLYKFIGCRGEAKAAMSAKGLPILQVELTSQYTAPSAAAAPALTTTGWMIEEAINSVNTGKLTVNGVDLAWSQFDWACGNDVKRIDLPGPQREVAIMDRKPTASATVLAPALAVFDPYALASANTPILISNTHGTVAGKKIKTDLKATISGVSEDQVEGMVAYKLSFTPTPVAGNDEITLSLI